MRRLWILLFIGLILRLILIPQPGFEADVAYWKFWGLAAADKGIIWLTQNTNYNYPAGFALLLWLIGKTYRLLGNPENYQQFWSSTNYLFLLLAIINFPKTLPMVIFFILASMVNPAISLVFLLFWFVAVGITFIQKPSLRKRLILSSLVIILTCGPIIVYYQHLFQTALPFSWFYGQQRAVRLTNLKGFVQLVGPAIVLAIFSLKDFWKKKTFITNLILAWAVLPFILFPFLGKQLPLSQERIFEISVFIPLAILSAQTIIKISQKINPKLILLLIIIFAAPYFYLSIVTQINTFAKPFFNVYIPKPTLEAFAWLDKNTADESVVVTSYYTTNMIPAFTHNKVFFGHDFVTYQAHDRLKDLACIFDAQSNTENITKLFRQHQIQYLLFTPESPRFESTNLAKVGLKLVFTNGQNQVYEFNL